MRVLASLVAAVFVASLFVGLQSCAQKPTAGTVLKDAALVDAVMDSVLAKPDLRDTFIRKAMGNHEAMMTMVNHMAQDTTTAAHIMELMLGNDTCKHMMISKTAGMPEMMEMMKPMMAKKKK